MVLNHYLSIAFDCLFLIIIFLLIKKTFKYDVNNLPPKKLSAKPTEKKTKKIIITLNKKIEQSNMKNDIIKQINELSSYKSRIWAALATIENLKKIFRQCKIQNKEISEVFKIYENNLKKEISATEKKINILVEKKEELENYLPIQICLN
jgi:hypothetical protein